MARIKSVAYVLAGGAFALMLFVLMLALFWAGVMCGSRTRAQEQSPGAKYTARVDESDCGALGDYDSEVEIHENRPRLGLSILGHSNVIVFTLTDAGSNIRLHWETPTMLVIECIKCKREDVHIRKTRWKQVSIKYILDAAGHSPAPK